LDEQLSSRTALKAHLLGAPRSYPPRQVGETLCISKGRGEVRIERGQM
jgi:hypothetical protein